MHLNEHAMHLLDWLLRCNGWIIHDQAQASAKRERAAGLSMHFRGLPPIFSQVFEVIRSAYVGESSVGAAERQEFFLIGQDIRNFC